MASLEWINGDRVLYRHPLRPGRVVLGRSDRCDLALPDEAVSRVHCVLDGRPEGWVLTNRSGQGTRVNGIEVERAALAEGDTISLGSTTLRLSLEDRDPSLDRTVPLAVSHHEELLDGDEEGVTTTRPLLRFTGGPRAGDAVSLKRSRTVLGAGEEIALEGGLPPRSAILTVSRSRPMVEPGAAPVYLAGRKVIGMTPVLPGEELRIGAHTMVIQPKAQRSPPEERGSFGEMVGRSLGMMRLFGALARMAAHDAPVLLSGESGTGKELAARAIHSSSPRAEGPFVAMNCAGIPETLFESELFGHEKGAFTGASKRQDGAFQRAAGGTLFLDEVGELRLEAQAKLLRALESGEVRRVGGASPEFPDVRVVSATNRDLAGMVAGERFRADLYFRLAVLTARLPPLRERPDDLVPLAEAILARHHPGATLHRDALDLLATHRWPGNARELRNVLTRAVVMGGPEVRAEHLSFNPWATERVGYAPRQPTEAELLQGALTRHGGNRSRAAAELGMPRSTLIYKLRKLGLDDG
ncbi:MAG: sigma 54-dependent Fis family transcriptional regulator [Deltaproteobacteria bacterium]|nr:sigma 54-dependent Fis family transcriptional regulator [Deltaproteobacteria bacterium]